MTQRIPTQDEVWLIDLDDEQPKPGETVLALTLGGVLIKEKWTSDSHRYLVAWCKHPKIPASVRAKMKRKL